MKSGAALLLERETPAVLTLQFTQRELVRTDGHVVEIRVPTAPSVYFTRDEARALARRITAFLEGTR